MAPPPRIRVGPFELDVPIGRGGMGQVWRGVHVEQGVPVAVKVITAERAQRPHYLTAFKNEVRVTAGLDHPSIVVVLDYGQIPAEAAERSGGRFIAGSPYLVMELLDGGSLKNHVATIAWPEVRATLLCLLDALAHAHARGMIHRDLKPANVLTDRARRFVKLTDFGLAHALDSASGSPEPLLKGGVGTPGYMPPEQIQRRWRDYGPWTDLYSLGCLAYELVSGRTPFGRKPDKETFLGHLRRDVPRLEPRIEVPGRLEPWIARLLEKNPRDRFRRAADAAHALLSFAPPPFEIVSLPGGEITQELSPQSPPAEPASGETVELDVTTADETLASELTSEIPAIERARSRVPAAVPPLPPSWRPKEAPRPSMHLAGAGLGLYGLRTLPLVGRERERDRLWAELSKVHASGRARAVVLEGPTGCGKTRLAEWLVERADEVGGATPLDAVHAPIPGPHDGIAAMLARHLSAVGLPRAELVRRIEGALAEQGGARLDEALALAELVSPAAEDPGGEAPIVRLQSASERHVLAVRFLERLARERPVIVWLEDVQWGLDALAVTELALASQAESPFPALFLMTVRSEALAPDSAEAAAIARLPELTRVTVGALEPELRPALVRELLGLEGELAGRVEERTAGNPLFAVQLVGDWVQRGVLVPGRDGFRLESGFELELPDDIHQVWSAHLDRLLAGRPADDRRALEIAAVLGEAVDAEEWRRVMERAGVKATPALVETLLVQRLAHAGERGPEISWSFVHGMLRESLERGAREAGRWRGYNHACAEVVRFRSDPGARERFGRHLLEAGHPAYAIEPLTLGALERLDAGEYRRAEVLLVDRERAMMEIDLPPNDPRWGEGWVHRGRLANLLGDAAASDVWTRRAADLARRFDWTQVAAMAHRELGRLARLRGDHESAETELEKAQSFARSVGDVRTLAEARRDVAYLHLAVGRLEDAAAEFRAAREHYDALSDTLGRARCDIGLGELAREAGRLDEAYEHVVRAREGFERSGSRKGVGECWNALGELARLGGELEKAEAYYREALELRRALGAANAIICELNIALVLLERGAYAEARATLEPCLRAVERQNNKRMMGCIHVCLLPATAALDDHAAFDRHLRSAAALLAQTGYVDVDNARMAELAGDLARTRGEHGRARDAYVIARQQWRALARGEEAAVETKLRALQWAELLASRK